MSEQSVFTPKQGQYLAFIHAFSKIHRQPPAQADLQRYFGTSAPTIHSMIVRLEELGLIERTPGAARAIRVLVSPQELPPLK